MKKIILTLLSIYLTITNLNAQDCGCTHLISNLSSASINVINANNWNYQPGDTFCIPAGNYAGIRLVGFNGTPEQPLTFINCGGKTTFSEAIYPAIDIKNSNYLRFTGSGDNSIDYGFHILSAPSSGLAVGNFSSDIELDHIEIEQVGFAGILAKTDPTCNDPMTWRSNGFVMKNLRIHDNYIHDTHGEGLYIGHTSGYKVNSNVSCNGSTVFAHWLEDVEVYNNRLENIGWDGIQLNLVRKNGSVHDNTIVNYGTQSATYQNFALSIGGGVYSIYNNYMENQGTSKGMQFISAQSGTKIFNNVLVNPQSEGIFLHSRHELDDPTQGYFIMNNTIINPEKSGVKLITTIIHSEDSNLIGTLQNDIPSYFINNAIINPGNHYEDGNTWKGFQENFIDFNTPQTRDKMQANILTNLFTTDITEAGFLDISSHQYQASSISSALVNQGTNINSYGVAFDINNLARPQGSAFDIGAFEFEETTPTDTDDTNGGSKVVVYPNPVQDYLHIQAIGKINEVSVSSIQGVLLRNYPKVRASNLSINLIDLPTGVYFVEIQLTGKKVVQKRIIKE